jgi:hypothetical protein
MVTGLQSFHSVHTSCTQLRYRTGTARIDITYIVSVSIKRTSLISLIVSHRISHIAVFLLRRRHSQATLTHESLYYSVYSG